MTKPGQAEDPAQKNETGAEKNYDIMELFVLQMLFLIISRRWRNMVVTYLNSRPEKKRYWEALYPGGPERFMQAVVLTVGIRSPYSQTEITIGVKCELRFADRRWWALKATMSSPGCEDEVFEFHHTNEGELTLRS